jgi:hypothetical protein
MESLKGLITEVRERTKLAIESIESAGVAAHHLQKLTAMTDALEQAMELHANKTTMPGAEYERRRVALVRRWEGEEQADEQRIG